MEANLSISERRKRPKSKIGPSHNPKVVGSNPAPATNFLGKSRHLRFYGSTHSVVELRLNPKNFINLAVEACSF